MAPSGKVSLTRRAEGRSPSSWLNCPTAFLLSPATNRHSLVALLLKHTQTRTHTMLHKANCPLACQSWGQLAWVEFGGGCMLEGWCGARWVTPFSPLLYAKEKECYMCTAKNLKWSLGEKMTSALKLYVLIDCDHSFIWLTQQLALKNWMQVSLFVCEGLCCAKKPASAANQPLWILIC